MRVQPRRRQLCFHPASRFCGMTDPSSKKTSFQCKFTNAFKDAAEPRMHMPPVSDDRVADCYCLQSTIAMGIQAYHRPHNLRPPVSEATRRCVLSSFPILSTSSESRCFLRIFNMGQNISSPTASPHLVSSAGFKLGLLTFFAERNFQMLPFERGDASVL